MRSPRRRSLTAQQRKFATPQASYRSGLEAKVAQQIVAAGHTLRFETEKLKYVRPQSDHTYCPDFHLDNGIIIETKGIFSTEDRQKHILVKAQHPDRDIRLVFSNAQAKIAKGSKTTYAMWADHNGIPWAHRTIPPEWLREEKP